MLMGLHKWEKLQTSLAIPAGHQGQFLLETHQFLQDPARRIDLRQQSLQPGLVVQHPGSTTVVATTDCLGHDREAEALGQARLRRLKIPAPALVVMRGQVPVTGCLGQT